jgi:hypothetical protein
LVISGTTMAIIPVRPDLRFLAAALGR